MERFTTITRTMSGPMNDELALLSARVVLAHSGLPAGQVEGVLVNAEGHVRFFVVRRARDLGRGPERLLVPLDGVEIGEEMEDPQLAAAQRGLPAQGPRAPTARRAPVLRLLWTVDQIAAQPGFEDDGHIPAPHSGGGVSRVPPGTIAIDRPRAVRGGVLAGVASGVAGGLVGLLAGGPIVAVAVGLFFGLGGGIAGAMSGGSRESAVEASRLDPGAPAHAGVWAVRELERALRSRALFDQGLLRSTPILPLAQVGQPRGPHDRALHAR